MWDVETSDSLKLRHTLAGHRGQPTTAAWSPDGDVLATSGNDHGHQETCFWDTETGKPWSPLPHTDRLHAVGWSPDGATAFGATPTAKTFEFWDVASGKRMAGIGLVEERADGTIPWPFRVSCSPDGKSLVFSYGGWLKAENVIDVWDTHTQQPRFALPWHPPLTAVAFSADGTTLVSA